MTFEDRKTILAALDRKLESSEIDPRFIGKLAEVVRSVIALDNRASQFSQAGSLDLLRDGKPGSNASDLVDRVEESLRALRF